MPGGRTAYRAARLFDGEAEVPRPTLLVEDGLVVAAGAAVPESVPVVDLGNVTVMPGLVDCHQHLCFDGLGTLEEQVAGVDDHTLAQRCRDAARRALRGGVTTLRDLGDRGWLTLPLREEPALPTILASGPPITIDNGHCWYLGGACARDDASLRAAVRDRAERGTDVVKIMVTGGNLTPTFPPWQSQFAQRELQVLVDEAHRRGLPVAAHCHGIDGIRDALDAGVDSIEHCTFLGPDRRPIADERLFARLAASGIAVSVGFGRAPGAPLAPEFAAVWDDIVHTRRRLGELGANVVAGTDAGITPAKPHDVLPHAFEEFLAAGFTATAALRAMTTAAATVCGVGARKGRLGPGHDADFVAVASDVLGHDGELVVSRVWKGGVEVG